MWWYFVDMEDSGGFVIFLVVCALILLGITWCVSDNKEEPKQPAPIEKTIPKWDTISNNDSIIVLKIHRQ
jgi:hypothetical protein